MDDLDLSRLSTLPFHQWRKGTCLDASRSELVELTPQLAGLRAPLLDFINRVDSAPLDE